jgi:hypothetical protein
MRHLRTLLVPALLLVAAAATSLLGTARTLNPQLPIATDTGPAGSAGLATYLRERGGTVEVVGDGAPTVSAGTRIIAAPTARSITAAEVAELEAFVRGGGTLVYLSADAAAQPEMAAWLELEPGPPLLPDPADTLGGGDPTGVTLEIVAAGGPTRGLKALRVGSGRGLIAGGALPIARRAEAVGLWWRAMGKGQVWIAAGPDLIENRRLELLDNLALWVRLSGPGHVAFVERHHTSAGPLPLSRGIIAFALQVLLCLAIAALALGIRFGPPQPLLESRHRSSLDHVRSLAWLLRRARVESELAAHQLLRLRQLARDRLGLPLTIEPATFARTVEERCSVPVSSTLALLSGLEAAAAASRVDPRDYAGLAQRAAKLERALLGERASADGSAPDHRHIGVSPGRRSA